MLKEKITPTPLVEKGKRKRVQIVDELKRRRFSLIYIVWRFSVYFFRVLLRKYTRKPDPKKTAIELREIFEELGGFWVKTGQLLALRTDLFSQEVCDELLRLQYGALGFPIDLVRSTIESELGASITDIFEVFNEEPLAAASIAQIHTAVLRKQRVPVVVKVQRPGLEEAFNRDLNIIKILARLLISLNIANYLRLDEAVAELEKIFNEELDYRYEATNIRRMRQLLKKHDVYAPKVYKRYSKRRVLVMEYIDGVLMSDYIRTLESDPVKVQRWEKENNVNREKVGERLFLSLLRQIFEDNLYHADLHPGNIILLRNSKFVLIDLGSVGSLDTELRNNYFNYTNALGREDFTKAADYLIRFAIDIPKTNIPRVRVEMARGIAFWAAKSRLDGQSYKEKSVGGATNEISKVSLKYKIPSNWGFLKISRTILTLDGSLQYLLTDTDTFKLLQKYSKQSQRRSLIQSLRLENIRASVREFFDTSNEYNRLILPKLRERTIAYEGTVNKFALALSLISKTLSYAVLIGGFVLSYGFLFQYYFNSIQPIRNQLFDDIARQLPQIPYFEWILIFIGLILTYQTLSACSFVLAQQEYEGKDIL